MTDFLDARSEMAREAMLDELARYASADAIAFNEDEDVQQARESVCLGCCRLRPDCVLTVITNTLSHYLAEVRCSECRAVSRFLETGEAA